MTPEFTLELAQQLHDSNQIVDFDWAWQVLGYSRKDSAKRTLVSYFEQNFDYFVQPPGESPEALPGDIFHFEVGNSKPGRPAEKIYLTVECFKEMGMLAKSEEGRQIRLLLLLRKACFHVAPLSQNFAPSQHRLLMENHEEVFSKPGVCHLYSFIQFSKYKACHVRI